VKKLCLGEKSCETKGGSQEMAAMMLMLINFNNIASHYYSISIIGAISWLPTFDFTTFFTQPFYCHTIFPSLAAFE